MYVLYAYLSTHKSHISYETNGKFGDIKCWAQREEVKKRLPLSLVGSFSSLSSQRFGTETIFFIAKLQMPLYLWIYLWFILRYLSLSLFALWVIFANYNKIQRCVSANTHWKESKKKKMLYHKAYTLMNKHKSKWGLKMKVREITKDTMVQQSVSSILSQ